MQYIKNCLTQDAFWQINKRLVQELGMEMALVLTDIIEKFYNYQSRGQTIIKENEHWFFYTSDSFEKTFNIKYKVQSRILGDLRDRGLIKTKRLGVPAKLHFTLCEKPIALMLNSSYAKMEELDQPKGTLQSGQNGQTYNTLNTNNSLLISKEAEEKSKRFAIPALGAVKEYFIERGVPGAEHEKFYDFYTSKGWMVGKNKMKDWKSAVRNWLRGREAEQPKEEKQQKISL